MVSKLKKIIIPGLNDSDYKIWQKEIQTYTLICSISQASRRLEIRNYNDDGKTKSLFFENTDESTVLNGLLSDKIGELR